jgi:hypothetical protein
MTPHRARNGHVLPADRRAFGVALLTAPLMAELNVAIAAVPGHQALAPTRGWRYCRWS